MDQTEVFFIVGFALNWFFSFFFCFNVGTSIRNSVENIWSVVFLPFFFALSKLFHSSFHLNLDFMIDVEWCRLSFKISCSNKLLSVFCEDTKSFEEDFNLGIFRYWIVFVCFAYIENVSSVSMCLSRNKYIPKAFMYLLGSPSVSTHWLDIYVWKLESYVSRIPNEIFIFLVVYCVPIIYSFLFYLPVFFHFFLYMQSMCDCVCVSSFGCLCNIYTMYEVAFMYSVVFWVLWCALICMTMMIRLCMC